MSARKVTIAVTLTPAGIEESKGITKALAEYPVDVALKLDALMAELTADGADADRIGALLKQMKEDALIANAMGARLRELLDGAMTHEPKGTMQ